MILRSKIVCAVLSIFLALAISVSSKISLNSKPINNQNTYQQIIEFLSE